MNDVAILEPRPDSALTIYLRPLLTFLESKGLTEVTVNRPGEVFTECADGWKRYEVPELNFEHCMSLARYVTSHNSKTIGSANPILSGTLPTGERIQIVTPPCSEKGTVSITIRKPSIKTFSLEELEAGGAFNLMKKAEQIIKPFEYELQNYLNDGKIKEFLILAMQTGRNLIISGRTGSGKTTVAKTLAMYIPKDQRIITIEDVREMYLTHLNRVHLLYDKAAGNGVSAKEAVEACLRMKPDRIILAECRGDEALSFVFALNTDHAGLSTIHSNGAFEALPQLASLVQASEIGSRMPMDYILKRVYSSIDIVLHYQNRKLMEVYYDPQRKLAALS